MHFSKFLFASGFVLSLLSGANAYGTERSDLRGSQETKDVPRELEEITQGIAGIQEELAWTLDNVQQLELGGEVGEDTGGYYGGHGGADWYAVVHALFNLLQNLKDHLCKVSDNLQQASKFEVLPVDLKHSHSINVEHNHKVDLDHGHGVNDPGHKHGLPPITCATTCKYANDATETVSAETGLTVNDFNGNVYTDDALGDETTKHALGPHTHKITHLKEGLEYASINLAYLASCNYDYGY